MNFEIGCIYQLNEHSIGYNYEGPTTKAITNFNKKTFQIPVVTGALFTVISLVYDDKEMWVTCYRGFILLLTDARATKII